jgi:hypothetical protein
VLLDKGHMAAALEAVLCAMRAKVLAGELCPHTETGGEEDPLTPGPFSLSSWVQLARSLVRIQKWCALFSLRVHLRTKPDALARLCRCMCTRPIRTRRTARCGQA